MAAETFSSPEQRHPQPKSRLGRLYLYSKDTPFIAQENFTTEALALAIEQDPTPVLSALHKVAADRRELLPPCPFDLRDVNRLLPRTQQYIPGKGFLDLVLEAIGQDGSSMGEVWVEVKIGADETGDQLSAYAEAASLQRNTWLVTLARTIVRDSVPNLQWLELYRAARETRPRHPAWVDLLQFLEEQAVASDALSPVSDSEAGALEPAFGLFQKASATLAAVHRLLQTIFSEPTLAKLQWKAEGDLLNSAAATFRQRGEFVATGGPIAYGLRSEDGIAFWVIAIRPPRATSTQADAIRQAADVALLDQWQRPPAGGNILLAQVRATSLPSHEQAVAWFAARLIEVKEAGIVSLAIGLESAPTTGGDLAEVHTSDPHGLRPPRRMRMG